MVYLLPSIFPNADSYNRVICVNGVGATKQSVLMVDTLPDLEVVSKSQCFPLYRYVRSDDQVDELGLSVSSIKWKRIDNISEQAIRRFRSIFPTLTIGREDLFYYVYGLLHSSDYQERFATNLLKQLPRIPAIKNVDEFSQFSKVGRKLGDLHVGYENATEYPLEIRHLREDQPGEWSDAYFRVAKMRFGKSASGEKDKSTIEYNSNISIHGIPLRAYDYKVNGKSAIEWVMERQCIKTDTASGIVNDANDFAIETVGDPRYPLNLLKKVVTVSLRTLDLISQLPDLRIPDDS